MCCQGYSESTIRRVGPPANVMRLYKVSRTLAYIRDSTSDRPALQLFLVNSMFLQLSLFFTITAISLWVDQLRHSSIAFLSRHSPIYYGLFIFTIVVRTIMPLPLIHYLRFGC